MEPQRIRDIKASLNDMSMEELQDMSDDLSDLISVLITRQVAVEDAILDRLEAAFSLSQRDQSCAFLSGWVLILVKYFSLKLSF